MIKIKQKPLNDGQWFEAEMDGKIVGFATSSLDGQNGQVVLDSIHVEPQHRKKGIGGALLGAVKNWGKECGAWEIKGKFSPEYKDDEGEMATRKFYRKQGISINEENGLSGGIK